MLSPFKEAGKQIAIVPRRLVARKVKLGVKLGVRVQILTITRAS